MKKWLPRIALVLLAVLLTLFIIAAALPVPRDPQLTPAEAGAGASSVEPSFTGLQREFPAVNEPPDNPSTAAKVELGRLLFFDPVLSAENDIACASCHHPDYGFGDGLPRARGAGATGAGSERSGGIELARNTPGLWNVAYVDALFWDGRADTLEDQSQVPLTHVDEMAADTAALAAELAAIPEYVDLFADAFGSEAITFEQVQMALAAFERTLISNDSPFDRYAAGDVNALTAPQRRGLTLFRSGATRCFECHAAPTFATDTFRVVGVPSDDPGRGGVADDAPDGAFRVPSLRNVALTAPYMHDGSLATLEAVVKFYEDGGGRAHGNADVDVFVRGFELTEQERADLVAFLYGLTDESARPAIPAAVPSGLPVVASLENPARAVVAANTAPAGSGSTGAGRAPQTITVAPGETIQAAVDRARPGDTIHVPYGIYHETVVIDMSDITFEGVPNEAGDWPILDGQNVLADGVIASGNNFKVGRLYVRNYTDNGVLVEGVTGVHFYDIFAENTGTYGIYPVQSTDVLIERMEVTGVHDAGIYAGQCEAVVVRDSVVYGNVLGIELENTWGGEVYNNHAYDNTLGILIVLLPNLTSKISGDTLIYDNLLENNNHENFAPEGFTAGLMPPGVGILLLSSDNNEVYNNTIRGNKTTGLALFSLESSGFFDQLDVGPNPENNFIHDNEYDNNGYDPDDYVRDLGVPVQDIFWDGTGDNNTFSESAANTPFPPLLPGPGWPTPVARAYWQLLNFVVGLVG